MEWNFLRPPLLLPSGIKIIPKPAEPRTLKEIVCRRMLGILAGYIRYIDERYPGGKYIPCKDILKKYFCRLPPTVRENMMVETKDTSSELHCLQYPPNLLAAEVLFSKGIEEFEIYIDMWWTPEHLDTMLQTLIEDGKTLRYLSFVNLFQQYSFTQIHYDNLRRMFVSANKLAKLDLWRTCDDTVMKIVGEACPCLQHIDILDSDVTRKGFSFLMQNIVEGNSKSNGGTVPSESRFWKFPDVFMRMEELVSPGEVVELYKRRKSPLCKTLRSVSMSHEIFEETYLSQLMILELAPQFETFHVRPHMEQFFTNLCKDWDKFTRADGTLALPTLNLKTVEIDTMTLKTFRLIKTMCPKLTTLIYHSEEKQNGRSIDFKEFNYFPLLKILELPDTTSYANEDIQNVSAPLRENLESLSLGNLFSAEPFRLHIFFLLPSSLQSLTLLFERFTWASLAVPEYTPLNTLKTVTLNGTIDSEAVIQLLEYSPNLEKFSTYYISGMRPDFIERLCDIREEPKIKEFVVSPGILFRTRQDLNYFKVFFTEIERTGICAF